VSTADSGGCCDAGDVENNLVVLSGEIRGRETIGVGPREIEEEWLREFMGSSGGGREAGDVGGRDVGDKGGREIGDRGSSN